MHGTGAEQSPELAVETGAAKEAGSCGAYTGEVLKSYTDEINEK